jgi:hypothetical protein
MMMGWIEQSSTATERDVTLLARFRRTQLLSLTTSNLWFQMPHRLRYSTQTTRTRFDSRNGQDTFIQLPPPDRLWGPSSMISNGYRQTTLSPRVNQTGRGTDRSSTFNSEIDNEWRSASTPPYVFMAQFSITITYFVQFRM